MRTPTKRESPRTGKGNEGEPGKAIVKTCHILPGMSKVYRASGRWKHLRETAAFTPDVAAASYAERIARIAYGKGGKVAGVHRVKALQFRAVILCESAGKICACREFVFKLREVNP